MKQNVFDRQKYDALGMVISTNSPQLSFYRFFIITPTIILFFSIADLVLHILIISSAIEKKQLTTVKIKKGIVIDCAVPSKTELSFIFPLLSRSAI